MVKINTLDLDFCEEEKALRIKQKIKQLPCCAYVLHKPSQLKGFHMLIFCKREGCDICRLVFDSERRFSRDLERPAHTRNVLFSSKTKISAEKLLGLSVRKQQRTGKKGNPNRRNDGLLCRG